MSPVTLALVLAAAPAPPQLVCHAREAEADRLAAGDRGRALAAAADACRDDFEATPAADFDRRSYLAFEAERIYRKAHAAGGADRPLCSAQRVLEAFAASLANLPPGERPTDREDVQAALQELAGQSCEPAPASDAGLPSTTQPASGADELLRSVSKPEPAPASPAPASPAPASPARPRRPLRIAGWSTFGVGVALGLGGVGALVRGALLREQVEALNAAYGSGGIPLDQAVDTEAGKRADRAALGLFIAGPVVAIAGSVLLAVDAVRTKRGRLVALHPSILPAAGLRFRLEF
jgi:hypothetical protein